jgi:hypothetical protein
MQGELLEQANIVSAFVPVDTQDGANNGDWVSMKNYNRALVVLFKDAGVAGDDPVFTLRQATDNSGTSAKALNFTRVRTKVGTQTGIGQFTLNTQSAANTYTDTDSAEAEAIMAVEVKAEDLDTDNGFDHIQLQIPDTGSAGAQLGCGFYILYDPRFAQESPPSAL